MRRRAAGERASERNGARSSVGIAQRFTRSVHLVRPGPLNFPPERRAPSVGCYSTVSMEIIENRRTQVPDGPGTGPALSLFERALAGYVVVHDP